MRDPYLVAMVHPHLKPYEDILHFQFQFEVCLKLQRTNLNRLDMPRVDLGPLWSPQPFQPQAIKHLKIVNKLTGRQRVLL